MALICVVYLASAEISHPNEFFVGSSSTKKMSHVLSSSSFSRWRSKLWKSSFSASNVHIIVIIFCKFQTWSFIPRSAYTFSLHLFFLFTLPHFSNTGATSRPRSTSTSGLTDLMMNPAKFWSQTDTPRWTSCSWTLTILSSSWTPAGEEDLSLIHIWRCRRSTLCRSRWSPYH